MASEECFHCGEPIAPGDRTNPHATPGTCGGSVLMRMCHWECSARAILGSVGHIRGQCTCYGGTQDDPPGMTKREAARAAVAEYQMREKIG